MTMPMPTASQSRCTEHSLAELIEEVSARMETGEPVELQAYLNAHPEHAGELRRLYPALQLLADFSRSGLANLPPDGLEPVAALGMPLGDFRILREIGRGGMGVVYEAEQLSLGRRVALKVLPFASTLDAKQLQRFKNEAQAAAHLHHQNIVQVFATGCERGVHYYAMQFIDGNTLAAFIAELRAQTAPAIPAKQQASSESPGIDGPATAPGAASFALPPTALRETSPIAGLPTERTTTQASFFRLAAWLGIQAAEALEHAHQLGIVHRDIKPANLLMDGRGNLWVADFGLAHCQSQIGLTMSGDLVGTLRYMSPEQALGQRLLVDHRTDIYSLGVTLYELLTLEPPFAGQDRQELLRKIGFEEPPLPRRLNKAIPTELETIVLKAMAKEPAERYASARDLADDLRNYLEDRPIRAKRPTWTQRLRKWQRRHRAAVMTGIVSFVLSLLGAVAALTISTVRITAERNQKEQALQQSRASQQAATRHLKQTLQAVDHMLGRAIHGPLVDIPQVEPVRRGLFEDALEFYQRILEECASNPELRPEMVRTNIGVGDIRHRLGQVTEAKEAYRRSIDLAEELLSESPDEPAHRYALAMCRLKYTDCLEMGQEKERELRASWQLWLGLTKQFPANTAYLFFGGNCQRGLAHCSQDAGRPDEAEHLFRQALAMHQKLDPSNFVFGPSLADDWYWLGTFLQGQGRMAEAESAYRNALKKAQNLKGVFPQAVTVQRRLALFERDLGFLLCATERRKEGREHLKQAITILREMLKDSWNPAPLLKETAALLEDAGGKESEEGRLFERERRFAEAAKAFCQALDYYEEDARITPDAPQKLRCQRSASYCMGRLGILWRLQGRFQQAEEVLRRSLALSQQLFKDFPQEGEQRRLLAESHDSLAWFLALRLDRQPHHAAEALEHALKALALQPERHDLWHTLGVVYCRQGHWKEALECIERSRQLENKPGPPDAHDRFFEAMAYSGLGDKEKARRCYDEGVQWMEKHAPNGPDLHQFRTEAAALLGIKDASTTKAKERATSKE